MHLLAAACFLLSLFKCYLAPSAPEALAPGLQVEESQTHPATPGWSDGAGRPANAPPMRPPPSVGATILNMVGGSHRAQLLRLFVHCNHGSDEHGDGESLDTALASVHGARDLIRQWRSGSSARGPAGRRTSDSGAGVDLGAAVVVEVSGDCWLPRPLELTATDAGSSANAPVVWRGTDGATLSSGRPITQWEAVPWPGAAAGTVLRANISGWPLDITSLRVVSPAAASSTASSNSSHLEEWVPRTRYPKADPKNYSAGWLTTAPWTCPTTLDHADNQVGTNYSIGLEPTIPQDVLAEPANLYFNGFGVGSWSRAGSSGEKDVLNQISRVVGFQQTSVRQPRSCSSHCLSLM